MDGRSIKPDTTDLERFSVFDLESWSMFQKTNKTVYLEKLALYVPEEYRTEYNKAFKEYIKRIHSDDDTAGGDDFEDPIRETRKEA